MFRLSALFILWFAASTISAKGEALFDPANGLDGWTERSAIGSTNYTPVDGAMLAQSDNGTASVIERTIAVDMMRAPQVSWAWRVDALQPSADIGVKGADDMGAAVIFVFGNPSLFNRPKTLIYVWANDAVEQGEIVPSPRSGKVKYVVLRAGETALGEWVDEMRDVVADFEAAFGQPPPPFARRLCFFTDSDQTGEPGAARYGKVKLSYSVPSE